MWRNFNVWKLERKKMITTKMMNKNQQPKFNFHHTSTYCHRIYQVSTALPTQGLTVRQILFLIFGRLREKLNGRKSTSSLVPPYTIQPPIGLWLYTNFHLGSVTVSNKNARKGENLHVKKALPNYGMKEWQTCQIQFFRSEVNITVYW